MRDFGLVSMIFLQMKDLELEKFKIQRPSRMSVSRALVNTSMSGHMSTVTETPAPATHSGHPTNHKRDPAKAQLKALPAPPVKTNDKTVTSRQVLAVVCNSSCVAG